MDTANNSNCPVIMPRLLSRFKAAPLVKEQHILTGSWTCILAKLTLNSKIESLYKLHRESYVMLSRFKRLDDFYISRKFQAWVLSIKPDPDLVAAIRVFERKEAMCSAKFEAILRQCKELKCMDERKNSEDGRPLARGPA